MPEWKDGYGQADANYEKWSKRVDFISIKKAEIWELHNKLGTEMYRSSWEQYQDMVKLGQLAQEQIDRMRMHEELSKGERIV